MQRRITKLDFCFIIVCLSLFAYAYPPGEKKALTVCNLFSNHMVLQQQTDVSFWGKATPGANLSVSGSWGKNALARANTNGNWKLKIATPVAGGPYTITIKTSDSSITINDVLIGEVWLASGQSNMDLPLAGWPPNDTVFNATHEIAQANYPAIRFLKVPFNISVSPLDSIGGKWLPASPETAGNFSATAYFYAKKLYQELHVPIGIIQSSIGGTPVEAWTSKGYLKKMGDFNRTLEGLTSLDSVTTSWFKKWPVQKIPATDEDWQNIQFTDSEASATNFDDKQWKEIKLPGRFDELSSGEFDGAMWFRKEFMIDDVSTDYTLNIGGIDDMDATYINGKKIGGLVGKGSANLPREMAIAKSLLTKGKNTIAIRAVDTGGPGSISSAMTISNDKGVTISLEGVWKKRLVAEIQKGKFYTYGLQADLTKRPDLFQLNSNTPSVLFNAMINPLVPYTIKGTIWYQGESNVGRAEQYKRLFPNMIEDWRSKWGYQFPFYFVQLAPYNYTDPLQKGQSQKLRNAQQFALKLPRTGMVSTLDIGRLSSAHPTHKQEVGERLARFALANDYGKNLVKSGPVYKNIILSGNKILVEFSSAGTGLVTGNKGLYGFEIAGADKLYAKGKAEIINNKVVVSNSSVHYPIYVRYAWSDSSTASLFNKEGLPAATFTSEK
ncbi:MAG: sialate O-acetylesterase [Bacteroidota bacterium]|nr:sialate O-acetylesterase [Bacteroidota bacterium]